MAEDKLTKPSAALTEENTSWFSRTLNLLEQNPITFWYSAHRRLHKAPFEIGEIIRWANANIGTDPSRTNLVGIGVGSLTATAAANRLWALSQPAKTLSLVYPLADLSGMVAASMPLLPEIVRVPLGEATALIFRRLTLQRQLPRVDARKLIIIPLHDLMLPQWSASPAADLAREPKEVITIETDYKGMAFPEVANKIHQAIRSWTTDKY